MIVNDWSKFEKLKPNSVWKNDKGDEIEELKSKTEKHDHENFCKSPKVDCDY